MMKISTNNHYDDDDDENNHFKSILNIKKKGQTIDQLMTILMNKKKKR